MTSRQVLITGAGGGIGRSLRETLRGVYPVLRLSDRVPLAPARSGNEGIEEVDQTDISDMARVERALDRVWPKSLVLYGTRVATGRAALPRRDP